MRISLVLFIIFAIGCSDAGVDTTCSARQTIAEYTSSPTARTVNPGGGVNQSFFLYRPMTVSRLMVKAITNGIASLTVTISKGQTGTNPILHSTITSATKTTGLTSTTLQEVWINLATPVELPALPNTNEPQDYYNFIVTSPGTFQVDYGATGNSNLRREYMELAGVWSPVPGELYNGISIGLFGTVSCQ